MDHDDAMAIRDEERLERAMSAAHYNGLHDDEPDAGCWVCQQEAEED